MARKQKQPATVERAKDSDIRFKLMSVAKEQIGTHSDGSPITEATRLKEDCGFDSLDLVELCIEVEDEFGTEIPDGDMEKFATVGDVLQWLVEHRDECVALYPK